MILNFQFKNWACYRDEACLSMQAGPERDEGGHLPQFGSASHPEKVLPVAAIYGGNASGKTQLVQAILFMQRFVLDSFQKGVLPYEPFLLDAESPKLPTEFTIQFLVGNTVYEYSFKLLRMSILSETLAYYTSRGIRRVSLFDREGNKVVVGAEWGTAAFQTYAAQLSLSEGQPFLALSYNLCKDAEQVARVYDWFSRKLVVLSPSMHYLGVEDFCADGRLSDMTVEYLRKFDTGIQALEPRQIELSSLPPSVVQDVSNSVRIGQTVRVQMGDGDVFTVTRSETGTLKACRVFAAHRSANDQLISFSMERESDGTRRMLDLIPAFAHLKQQDSDSIYVIDEIDRSLHYLVSRAFISEFIGSCGAKSRSQLIFTTHDLLLMDQELLRRDETYIVDKSPDGDSMMTDLRQFRGLRKDTDVRSRYLEGRFGGIVSSLRLRK